MSKNSSKSLRLDRYLASVTDYSRSDAKKLIKSGEITVDAIVVRDPAQGIAADAEVRLSGHSLRPVGPRYIMLNKPQGFICAARDRRHQTVLDLMDEDNPERLHVAGRLDIDTTGLVLLTDDGAWSHAVTSPQRQCWKSYYVETAEVISEQTQVHFSRGVFLKDDKARTLPAELSILGERVARLKICEGRYHQVKRMFGAEGNAVTRLHREAIGEISLDADLAEGEYRYLTADEVASVQT
ncbi:MAG: pseudouridine synthase [Zhongshania sp.]|uniref:pseudouridine synthase n=1 Tax=Zhongshania sp. TaxID=1971902 RepID=UPI0026025FD2|nr:pseudouridine synthase [Zhongshania sp.]MDF1691211.1 pseudouridine synthase [Zhongshania sp.]